MGKYTRNTPPVEPLMAKAIEQRDAEQVINLLHDFFYEKAMGITRRYNIGRSKRDKLGDDIVQEAMIKMYRYLTANKGFNKFESEAVEYIIKYFLRIVKNECLNEGAVKVRTEPFDNQWASETTNENIDREIDLAIMQRLLKQELTKEHLQILEMTVYGFDLQEIADQTGMGLSNVKYHKGEAKRKAAKILSQVD